LPKLLDAFSPANHTHQNRKMKNEASSVNTICMI